MEILVRFVKSLFVFLFSLICLVSCNFDEIFFFGDGDIDDRTSLVTSYILYDENPQVNPKAKFVTADFEFGSLLNPDAIFSNYYLRPGYTATGWMLVDDSYHDMSDFAVPVPVVVVLDRIGAGHQIPLVHVGICSVALLRCRDERFQRDELRIAVPFPVGELVLCCYGKPHFP